MSRLLVCRAMSGAVKKEKVWAYPRPPRLEQTPRHLRVLLNEEVIADSKSAYRVLETTHPPTYYFPLPDVKAELLSKSGGGTTFCEWKGIATYWDINAGGEKVVRRAWSYENPTPGFEPIKGYISFYASPFKCYVDDEEVVPQEGFYGGWITSDLEGPFKGGPGTMGW